MKPLRPFWLKQLFICPRKERLQLNISSALLKQAKQGDSYAQLTIGAHYFHQSPPAYIKKSIYWFTLAAQNNNKEAMFILGTLYLKGKNIPQDLFQALFWYQTSALLGYKKSTDLLHQTVDRLLQQQKSSKDNSQTIYQLATHYANGSFGLVDYERAYKLYQRAAELGNDNALVNLGSLYEKGLGVNRNPKKAAQIYQQAAELGNSTAMLNIGILYLIGEGIQKDDLAGIYWLSKSSQQGNSKASFNLGVFYYEQKNINQALNYFNLAANDGHIEAMYNLGVIYNTDQNDALSIEKADQWFKKASALGHKNATIHLANNTLEKLALEASKGDRQAIKQYIDLCITLQRPMNHQQLITWLHNAAELGSSDAMVDIGNFYSLGTPPLTKDPIQAIQWFTKACALKNHQAMNLLGQCYLNGLGVDANQQIAMQWFEKSSQYGNDKAMVNLAQIYLKSNSQDKDYQSAHFWLVKAAQNNNKQAMMLLLNLYKNGFGVSKNVESEKYWQQQLTSNK